MNLSPREPSTVAWPLYLYPPPHFLIGYQYLVKTCNDYIFDTRSYSRLKYNEIIAPHQHLINWTILANCSYTINTGAYHRFINLNNFEETLNQIQQTILLDRVVADIALINPMRGYGITNIDTDKNVPVEHLIQEQYKNMQECNESIWGLSDRVRLQKAGKKDLVILQAIRKLKTAYFKFLISNQQPIILSLPCDCDWLEPFVETFSDENYLNIQELANIPIQHVTTAMISALSMPTSCTSNLLSGGAFELRPREGGRAVTEQMRRNRGEMIERFVDRLPVRRRRRAVEIQPLPEEIEEESTFLDEVREAISGVIQMLEQELTATQRNQNFFNFAVQFYNIFQRLEATGNISEAVLRRWVLYFFTTEHIATTLNFLHYSLRLRVPFNRIVELILAQVVLRARNENGDIIYSRIWNEYGSNAFQNIMGRISMDLSETVERADMGIDEQELNQFMADISYHDNSGDVQEILRQLQVNDADIESIELSFRLKVTGPVAFTQNQEIQRINSRVIQHATSLRRQQIDLPPLNAQVRL